MKNRSQLFVLIVFSMVFSCTNIKRGTSKEEAKSNTDTITQTHASPTQKAGPDSLGTKKHDNDLLGMNYFFSNDTLCQTLSIKEISKNYNLKIPQKLDFKLVFHDMQHKYEDKVFEGVAHLTSSEESFSDNLDKDGGDYFAADYNFDAANYNILIRLDIQKYEACVVLVTTTQPEIVLGGYIAYLKKFPNDGVMKKGECK